MHRRDDGITPSVADAEEVRSTCGGVAALVFVVRSSGSYGMAWAGESLGWTEAMRQLALDIECNSGEDLQELTAPEARAEDRGG